MNDNVSFNGIIGTSTSLGGVVISLFPHVEAWVRLSGGIIGLIAGILTCIYMIQKISKQ
jgi:hypothetical protein